MAGHSHSNNVKYRKDRQTKKKSGELLSISKRIVSGEILSDNKLNYFRKKNFSQKKIDNLINKKTEFIKNILIFFRPVYNFNFLIIFFSEEKNKYNIINRFKIFKDIFYLESVPLDNLNNYFKSYYSFIFSNNEEIENFNNLIFDNYSIIEELKIKVYFQENSIVFDSKKDCLKIKDKFNLKFDFENFFYSLIEPFDFDFNDDYNNYYSNIKSYIDKLIEKKFLINVKIFSNVKKK